MTDEKIARINQLAKKSKAGGLTPAEQAGALYDKEQEEAEGPDGAQK